jgi:hypothetical protein
MEVVDLSCAVVIAEESDGLFDDVAVELFAVVNGLAIGSRFGVDVGFHRLLFEIFGAAVDDRGGFVFGVFGRRAEIRLPFWVQGDHLWL